MLNFAVFTFSLEISRPFMKKSNWREERPCGQSDQVICVGCCVAPINVAIAMAMSTSKP